MATNFLTSEFLKDGSRLVPSKDVKDSGAVAPGKFALT
jgi:hypothetical protein